MTAAKVAELREAVLHLAAHTFEPPPRAPIVEVIHGPAAKPDAFVARLWMSQQDYDDDEGPCLEVKGSPA